jgi:hypothetical protein
LSIAAVHRGRLGKSPSTRAFGPLTRAALPLRAAVRLGGRFCASAVLAGSGFSAWKFCIMAGMDCDNNSGEGPAVCQGNSEAAHPDVCPCSNDRKPNQQPEGGQSHMDVGVARADHHTGIAADGRARALLAILVRTPDEAQLPIVSLPCEHFSVAQDALSGPRCPGGTFSFDHLIDRAADAGNSEVGHGRKHAPVRHAPLAARMPVMPLVSPASVRGLFSLSGRHCHALKKDRRAFYWPWPRPTGTVNLPPPRLGRVPSSLHDEVGWIKFQFFTHAG